MDATIEDIRDLVTVRTFNALRVRQRRETRNVLTFTDNELLKVHNFGRFCLRDLRRALARWRADHPLSFDETHPLHQEP